MATTVKISALTPATSISGSEEIEIVQSGASKSATASQIYSPLVSDLANSSDAAKGAALVGYKGRTVRARLSDCVSVKDFGAVGDGVNDDAAAVQAALNASTSRTLVFPTGTYKFDTAVVGDGSQLVMYEAGVATTGSSLTGVQRVAFKNGLGALVDIRRTVRAPTGVSGAITNINSGKGDNTTFIGVSGGYFQSRDESDVDATSKGVLYGLQLSVVPRVIRDNIPYDDATGLVVRNDADVSGSRATDALYVGRNSSTFPNDEQEWITGCTIGANVGYGYRTTGANYTGFNAAGRMIGTAGNGFSFIADPTIQSTVTTAAQIFRSEPATQAASFTLTSLRHFTASQGTLGASSAVTNQTGFLASSSLSGATNNYGFVSQVPNNSGCWNFYASSDAKNWFAGQTLISSAATAITSAGGVSGSLQVAGTTGAKSAANFGRFSNDVNGPSILFSKSRGTTVGANGVLSSGDVLFSIEAGGDDGAAQVAAARVTAAVDATPGSGSMPGRLTFLTTPSGSTTPAERMRLDNKGNVIVGLGTVANGATDGFLYIPSTASAAPSGTPTAYSGRNPMVLDAANLRLYINVAGTWRYAALT